MSILMKLTKSRAALEHALWRRALRHGVAPSIEHRALMTRLAPLASIVDVGANVGQFALLCRVVFPEAKIHSFEPMRDAAATFEKVMAGETDVTLHRLALGASAGTAAINVTRRADSSSLLEPTVQTEVFPGTDKTGTEEITVATLAETLDGTTLAAPALLKIDVQGFEGEVLRGCESMLSQFDLIYVEASFIELYAGQPLAHEIITWLGERSFDLDGVYMGPDGVKDGRAIQADLLFRRRQA